MKLLALLTTLFSVFGLISCSSDTKNSESVEKVIYTKDNFEVPPPKVLFSANYQNQDLTTLNNNKDKPLSLFERLEFEVSQVKKWALVSQCQQNGSHWEVRLELPLKTQFPIYELLPTAIIKNELQGEVVCQWEFLSENSIGSSYAIKIKDLHVKIQDWSPQIKLIDLNSNTKLETGSYLSLKQIKELLFYVDPQTQHEEFSLLCGELPELKTQSYNLDPHLLPWDEWMNQQPTLFQNQTWPIKKCRFFTWHKQRITSWSPEFFMYNPVMAIANAQTIGRSEPSAMTFQIDNTNPYDIYVQISKQEFNSAFQIITGFNLLSSQLTDLADYKNRFYQGKAWLSSHQIVRPILTSPDAAIVAQNENVWFFKLPKTSQSVFHVQVARQHDCEKIYIYSTHFIKKGSLSLTFFADLTPAGQKNPVAQFDFNEIPELFVRGTLSPNPSDSEVLKLKVSDFVRFFRDNQANNKNYLELIKNNYDPDYYCNKPLPKVPQAKPTF